MFLNRMPWRSVHPSAVLSSRFNAMFAIFFGYPKISRPPWPWPYRQLLARLDSKVLPAPRHWLLGKERTRHFQQRKV